MSSPSAKPTCLSQPVVKSVMVYRNGDPFFSGRRVVIHEKKMSSFDVFLKEVTGGVNAPFGAVRNIYTPRNGHRIHQLDEIQSGEHYVAGGREAFKKLNYLDIGEQKKKPIEINNEYHFLRKTVGNHEAFMFYEDDNKFPFKDLGSSRIKEQQSAFRNAKEPLLLPEEWNDCWHDCLSTTLAMEDVKPVTHSRINVSARFRKPLQEPCTVFLIANGDLISPAVRLFIPRKTLSQWEHVLEMVTEKVTLRSGAVHRLYTLDGKLIANGLELENGQFYVAVGRDKFKKLPYNELPFSKTITRRSYGLKSSSLPPGGGSGKSKGSSKSTDTADTSSPQPPKRKEKLGQNQESKKPEKSKENAKIVTKSYVLSHNDEGVFKAGKKRSETRGAVEVQEDEETQTEVPVDQRPAETVDEEENTEADHKVQHQEEYAAVNGEADQGGETGETTNGNGHEMEEVVEEEAAQDEQSHEQGGRNEENGEEMDHSGHEEEPKEVTDDQTQTDRPSAPRVTITSPQEIEKNEQSNDVQQ